MKTSFSPKTLKTGEINQSDIAVYTFSLSASQRFLGLASVTKKPQAKFLF